MAMRSPRPSPRSSGHALVFGVLTFFFLAMSAIFVGEVAQVVKSRLQIQKAADAAAYAGALIEADAASAIAWTNDAMAYLWYHGVRYAVDTAESAVLARFKTWGPVPAPDSVIGFPNPASWYQGKWRTADREIPRIEEWLVRLGRVERAIALVTPALIEREATRIAAEGGADRVALFPKVPMFPEGEGYLLLDIYRIGPNDWRIESSTGYYLEVRDLGDESYRITVRRGPTLTEILVQKIGPDYFEITSGGRVIRVHRTERGGVISVPGSQMSITRDGDTYTITLNGRTTRIRETDQGFEQEIGGAWVPIDRQDVALFGNNRVRVQNSNVINLGPFAVGVQSPPVVTIGGTTIVLSDPIQITAQVGPASIRVGEGYVVVNGLSTLNPVCLWFRYGDDRTRHRMCLRGPAWWQYEWRREESLLLPDNMDRFALTHGIGDNDASFRGRGALPEWTGWFDATSGRARSGSAYHQTRRCWNPRDLVCPVHRRPEGNPPREPNGWYHEVRGNRVVRVDCPTCRGNDVDGDGITEVRIRLGDTYRMRGSPGLDAADRQTVDRSFERPLRLSESFFKFGINVAAWRERDENLFPAFFSNPEFGYYAFASARAGIQDDAIDRYRYEFPDPQARETWVNASPENLYEPDWEARLWPIRTAIRDEDILAEAGVDTGFTFMLRGFTETEWYDWDNGFFGAQDTAVGPRLRDLTYPSRGTIDLRDPGLDALPQH